MADQDDQRKLHWESVYRDKSPEHVSWYQNEPGVSLQLIEAAQLDATDALIDVGGGASRLVDYLLHAGYRDLSVLDIAATALRHARIRLGDTAASVHWIEADITRYTPNRRYRLWHDRAVFHFLTDAADRRAYLNALHLAIEPGGQVIIAAFALDGPSQCSGLDIVRYSAASLQTELGPSFTLLASVNENHLTPANKLQKFGYHRFVCNASP